MALTQDQSTALQEAIDNLNHSVEVNKEVLETLRSVGNTGVVDIATHNTDPDAHPSLNAPTISNLLATQMYIKNRAAWAGTSAARFDSNTSEDGETTQDAIVLNLYSYISEDQNVYPVLSSHVLFSDKETGEYGTGTLFSVRGRIKETENYTTHSYLNLKIDSSIGGFVRVGGRNTDASFFNYDFSATYFYCDKQVDIGSSTYQFKDCYLQNSPIVSSDERLKQNIEEVPEAVFKAWARVNFKQYRFKEAVAQKGENARKHVGLIAQQILAAFQAEGLDATAYGIVCHDSWDDQYVDEQVIDAEAVYDKDGKVVTPEKSHTEKRFVKAAGDVWTVRYEEALALETAYQRWRLSKIEAALAAKGITL